ncbi:SDR family NAD(P)-dependent oxidoreductase [Microbacterium sp.]|uniref:SDR family NAD(P)-dependent oxidoreductase n=1 Tax=Microbacterium sp. TaxID=51671 RepID=UPI0032217394
MTAPLRVVITGASSGIGAAVAERFRREGDRLLLTGRRTERPATARSNERYLPGDLGDDSFVARLVSEAAREFGEIDALVLCHGLQSEGSLTRMSVTEASRVIDANLLSVFSVVHCAVPLMSRERGSIVCVASRLGMVGMPGQVLYSAAKGGLIMFARAAAVELAPEGVRVNVVAPGLTMTPVIRDGFARHDDPDTYAAERAATIPLGRLAEPAEIAEPIYFLASPASSYVTGVVLPIDGGYTAA